ncbi:unnamed protein product [Arctogadus glacialis]
MVRRGCRREPRGWGRWSRSRGVVVVVVVEQGGDAVRERERPGEEEGVVVVVVVVWVEQSQQTMRPPLAGRSRSPLTSPGSERPRSGEQNRLRSPALSNVCLAPSVTGTGPRRGSQTPSPCQG